jgi:hypothetical protein
MAWFLGKRERLSHAGGMGLLLLIEKQAGNWTRFL